jgi:hypothetical protein
MSANPYQAPTTTSPLAPLPPGTLTFAKALGYVLVSMALFAALGAAMGLIIGMVIPQYYVGAVGAAPSQAVAAGFVLGVAQGGGLGVAVGVALVAIIAWLQSRIRMIDLLKDRS